LQRRNEIDTPTREACVARAHTHRGTQVA
jgi:hypothetical protein